MITQPAFDWSAREMVLHTVSEKHLRAAIIASDGNGHADEAFRPFTTLADVVGKLEKIRDTVELFGGHREDWIVEKLFSHASQIRGLRRVLNLNRKEDERRPFFDVGIAGQLLSIAA